MQTRVKSIALVFGAMMTILSSNSYSKTSHLRSTSSVMLDLFEPISLLLPIVFEEQEFSNPSRKQEIISYLERLDANVKILENHSRDKAGDFKYISSSFTKDIHGALNWYKKGHIKEARFVLNHLTENCIACHEMIPSQKLFPRGADFFKKVNIDKLSDFERARLKITMRQFAEAADVYEKAFLNPLMRPASWVAFDALTQYLKLTITVNPNFNRAKDTFKKIMDTRTDLPDYLKNYLVFWIKSLEDIVNGKLSVPINIPQAQKLVSFGEKLQNFPADRSGLVYFILARSILEQVINGNVKLSSEKLSEVYYLLGLIELTIERTFWISQVDNYLELSIREAPKSESAFKAYNLLEENIYHEFTGSSGTQIPTDKQILLSELNKLMKVNLESKRSSQIKEKKPQ